MYGHNAGKPVSSRNSANMCLWWLIGEIDEVTHIQSTKVKSIKTLTIMSTIECVYYLYHRSPKNQRHRSRCMRTKAAHAIVLVGLYTTCACMAE